MKNQITGYIKKTIPAQDKLKHFFIGALAFAFFSIFFSGLISVAIIFFGAWAWELIQKATGGTNSIKEIFKDVFFGVLLGLLINIVSWIKQLF